MNRISIAMVGLALAASPASIVGGHMPDGQAQSPAPQIQNCNSNASIAGFASMRAMT